MSLILWLGIKNDYRTLIGLKGVNVVDVSIDIEEEEGDDELCQNDEEYLLI
jgi:hypothetical protein